MRALVGIVLLVALAPLALAGQPPFGGPAAEKAPPPSLKVESCADSVILLDGTKLTGTIVAVGMKLLIMIEDGATAERSIARDEVESFRYGKSQGSTTAYKTEVNPDIGLPVIVGEDDGTSAEPAPKPGAKPAPAMAPRPKPAAGPAQPANSPAKADLSKLWSLLGGNASADELKAALAANPQWRREIGRLLRGEVPAEGADVVAKFKERLAMDPELRKAVEELTKRNRPQGGMGGERAPKMPNPG